MEEIKDTQKEVLTSSPSEDGGINSPSGDGAKTNYHVNYYKSTTR